MHIDLAGKTALVTASTAGIGRATALGLARAGAQVAVNGRTVERVEAAARAIEAAVAGAEVLRAPGDLTVAAERSALFEALPEVDILVNNLGIYEPAEFDAVDDDAWRRFFEVNVLTGVQASRAYLPGMMARGWGRVVFISSESAINIPAEMIHYGMTKTAQLAIARGLAKHAAGTGVTVNAVLPGPTASEGLQAMLEDMVARGAARDLKEAGDQLVEDLRPSSLIRRMAEPEEVANLVVYVCSPQASATTGAALRVEGGIVDTPF